MDQAPSARAALSGHSLQAHGSRCHPRPRREPGAERGEPEGVWARWCPGGGLPTRPRRPRRSRPCSIKLSCVGSETNTHEGRVCEETSGTRPGGDSKPCLPWRGGRAFERNRGRAGPWPWPTRTKGWHGAGSIVQVSQPSIKVFGCRPTQGEEGSGPRCARRTRLRGEGHPGTGTETRPGELSRISVLSCPARDVYGVRAVPASPLSLMSPPSPAPLSCQLISDKPATL